MIGLTSSTTAILRRTKQVSAGLQKSQNAQETGKINEILLHLPKNPPFWICHVFAV